MLARNLSIGVIPSVGADLFNGGKLSKSIRG